MEKTKSVDEFLKKVASLKGKAGVDLSTAEDLSIAVMNLISLEEHFFFTGMKTKKDEYFDTQEEIREIRKELLATLMPNHEGETWCISKHLLGAVMRLIEVGSKLRSEDKEQEAKKMFEKAYRTYAIFWALKLQLITGGKIKETASAGLSAESPARAQRAGGSAQAGGRFEDLLNQLADCCDE